MNRTEQYARYFEVTMEERNGRQYKTHVWASSEYGVRDCMALTEPEDKVVAWRVVECPCDGEGRCSFHRSAPRGER